MSAIFFSYFVQNKHVSLHISFLFLIEILLKIIASQRRDMQHLKPFSVHFYE